MTTPGWTFVCRRDGRGHGAVYRLDIPVPFPRWEPTASTRFVWVSTAVVPVYFGDPEGEVETYAFPCTATGEVVDWAEIPGSAKGETQHEPVLARVVAWAQQQAQAQHRPVEDLTEFLRQEVQRLTDPHPAVREAHVAVWQTLLGL